MAPIFPDFDELHKPDDEMSETSDRRETARERKRSWFRGKYDVEGARTVKQKTVCKFFATTGRCRNGANCAFVHERGQSGETVIDQPCKFLYQEPFRCGKGASCHFSHEASRYPCPFRNLREGERCVPLCQFDHTPLEGEEARMRFVQLYHPWLSSMERTEWDFYLREWTEEEMLHRLTRGADVNLFRFAVGTLPDLP